ncbi:hypothetical protein GGR58DRAFT_262189 [Xylaria digitata]|nr:hypothetical protein GGR58DRAFT_262189 [Xylaria digitata]
MPPIMPLETGRRGLITIEELVVDITASADPRIFTNPIANIITRKQTTMLPSPNSALGVREIVRSMRKEKSIANFWSGYSAGLLLALNSSLKGFFPFFSEAHSVRQPVLSRLKNLVPCAMALAPSCLKGWIFSPSGHGGAPEVTVQGYNPTTKGATRRTSMLPIEDRVILG